MQFTRTTTTITTAPAGMAIVAVRGGDMGRGTSGGLS